jgi:hypothetical protein
LKLARTLAFGLAACGAHPRSPRPPTGAARLEVHVDARDVHAVAIEAHFVNAGTPNLRIAGETVSGVVRFEVARSGAWAPLDPQKLSAQECVVDCNVRYTVDLAHVERSYEGVVAIGTSTFVAPTSSWLAHPQPMPRGSFDITIEGSVDPPRTAFEGAAFATGLRRRDPTHFTLPTDDFAEGSFAAFGHVRHRLIDAAGSTIEIAIVGDAKLTLTDDEVATWVREDAECIARLYTRFPVPRATVFIVPIEDATDVVFGKVLSLGGASIIALTGTALTAKGTHSDWVLVHEMTHLGFPTMYGVRWLTEGLATYYEPVLRTRAGWHTPEWLWGDFATAMKRGVPAEGAELALEKRDSIDDWYWGGALFVMMADVAIRGATSNQKSFDDVMRAVLRKGGDATVVWSMEDVIATARAETGTNVFGDFVTRYATKGQRVDLERLLRDLGVKHGADTKIVLDDNAPLGALRKAIEGR